MPTTQECETVLLEHLAWIRRTTLAMGRRRGVVGADAEDFTSWAIVRLVENDYAVLRKFRGDSCARTFLRTVIDRLARQYRVQEWGRWRPSAAARRGGRIAVELETLVHRDRVPVRQAFLTLHTRHGAALAERELARVLASLPARLTPRAALAAAPLADADPAAPDGADTPLALHESLAERRDVDSALARAFDALGGDDRRLVRLHFWDGLTIAQIARRLDVPQKPLYRRLARALDTLERALRAHGVTREHARAVLDARVA